MAAIKENTTATVVKPVLTQTQGVVTKNEAGSTLKLHPADASFFKDHKVVS